MIAYALLCISLASYTPYMSSEKISLAGVAPDFSSADVTIVLDKDESLFHDSITFTGNNPHIKVQSWSSSAAPQSGFDTSANMVRQAYTGTVTFHVILQSTPPIPSDSSLLLHYLGVHHQFPQEQRLLLTASNLTSSPVEEQHSATETKKNLPAPRRHSKDGMPSSHETPSLFEQGYEYLHQCILKVKAFLTRFTDKASALFSSSSSRFLQIIMAFLLGVLMSLTPCIYPMIPITVGLLGASSSNSWIRNFMLSGCYTIGMATTFACLGLVTVLFGAQCGKLLCNPWFIAFLIAFLAYCGGSMLGLYEFYTPRILQPSGTPQKGGRLFSAFAFGIISGTVASPCMSPGLALILSAVAKLGNSFLAFSILFGFGVGASMPLLIIGTFSGALNVLPRAGMWMNDVKKAFGFLLIMMCFYYAQALIPAFAAWLGAAVFALICGVLYALRVRSATTKSGVLVIIFISTILITIGLFTAYRGFMVWHATKSASQTDYSLWNTNYAAAKLKAEEEHKFILADFTASWCPTCVLLDKEILQHTDVAPIFEKVIAVKVDGSSNRDPQYHELTRRFNILGIPQLLLIDPATERVVHVWGSELLNHPAAKFRDELLGYVK